ncbi:unannotated protein [freshwater metagenome]|uniref:Unannotated protein n=1 Tax=freshwater metagenome TaxID=449393 RepID=A0A6J6TQX8_9ZZZZ
MTPVMFPNAKGRRYVLASLLTSGEPVGDGDIVTTPREVTWT